MTRPCGSSLKDYTLSRGLENSRGEMWDSDARHSAFEQRAAFCKASATPTAMTRESLRERPGYLAHESPCKEGCRIPSSPSAGHEPTSGMALCEHRHSTE